MLERPKDSSAAVPTRIGLVVHPSRDIDEPLRAVREWASARAVEVFQVRVPGQHREVADPSDPEGCDLLVAIGGDGTTLAAIRAAATTGRPVLGVACGSLGVLTAVPASGVPQALERFASGDWVPRKLGALHVERTDRDPLVAFNDIAMIRAGEGQLRIIARVDGVLLVRFAGDGCIVSTAVGSSAYTLAAGGPLLAPGTDGFVITPLAAHGGSCPPTVIGARSELEVEVQIGYGGARLEVDGQVVDTQLSTFTITLRPSPVILVVYDDEEPLLAGLRRRGIIVDSPRILAEDRRR